MKRTVCFIFLPILLYSCRESLVDIHVDDASPVLVVGGLFAPGEQMVVKLTRSVPIRESIYFSGFDVEDAKVELYEEDQLIGRLNFRDQFFEDGDVIEDFGAYYTEDGFFPEQGNSYTLKVEAPGFSPVSATSIIPKDVEIQKFEVEEVAFRTRSFEVLAAQVTFMDDPTQKNFYALEILGKSWHAGYYDNNDDLIRPVDSSSHPIKATLPDKIDFENEDSPFRDNIIYLSDDAFNGEEFSMDLSIALQTDLASYISFEAQLKHITEAHFLYGTTAQLQEHETAENPFSQPVQVFGNVQNGLGVFAGYGKSRLAYVLSSD